MVHKRDLKRMDKWIDKGSAVAVYKNVDLGHPELGRVAFMRVGGKATIKTAPQRMPDSKKIPIAFRYYLQKVIRSKKQLRKVK